MSKTVTFGHPVSYVLGTRIFQKSVDCIFQKSWPLDPPYASLLDSFVTNVTIKQHQTSWTAKTIYN